MGYEAFAPVWPAGDTDRDRQNLKLVESRSYANRIQKLVYDVTR